mgnify:FL=1
MLKQKASIVPIPPPRPFAEEIAVDVLALEKNDGQLPTCYICFETDRVEPSPCACGTAVHIYPCLEMTIEKTGDANCTICRSEFESSALKALASQVRPFVEEERILELQEDRSRCHGWCGLVLTMLAHGCLVVSIGFIIFALLNVLDFYFGKSS